MGRGWCWRRCANGGETERKSGREDPPAIRKPRQRFGVRQPQLPLLYVRALPVAYQSGSCGYRTPNRAIAYYDDEVSGTIIYLDICALKRPLDDARDERIRRTAE